MSWFWKPKPVQVQVIRRDETKLRMHEWRADPALCTLAAKVLNDPNLQLMLSVLKNEHPAKTALPYGVHMDDRVVLQARSEGYEMFMANLEALASHTAQMSVPEAVFERELILKEQP